MATKTDAEVWAVLESLDDLLDPATPDAEVDHAIRDVGLDPLEISKKASAFAVAMRERQRTAWQAKARARLTVMEATAASVTSGPMAANRDALLARLEELRQGEGGADIRLAARRRKAEESSLEELQALVREMELLRALAVGRPEE